MNRLKPHVRRMILHALCEGMSQRSCERIFEVALDTVQKLFAEVGDMAIEFVANKFKGLVIPEWQSDELWSFVGRKDSSPDESANDAEEGEGLAWIWLSLCANSKFIGAYQIGPRTRENAEELMKKTAACLKRNDDGSFFVRPTIITDGLKAYQHGVAEVFENDVRFGQAEKVYVTEVNKEGKETKRKRYKETKRVQLINAPPFERIHTCYIERQNLNLRMQNRRFTRKSNAFSKTMLNHERHVALWIMYHNFVWIPERVGISAATALNFHPEIWSVSHLLALADEFVARRARHRKSLLTSKNLTEHDTAVTDDAGLPTHWVYRSFHHSTCKVHLSTCSNCRNGVGKGAKKGLGEWLSFHSFEAAMEAALAITEGRTTVCKMCLGKYSERVKHKTPPRG